MGGGGGGSSFQCRKQEVQGTTDSFRLAPAQPVTIETEIPLAYKQQPVAMGTVKTGIPGDRLPRTTV